MTGHLSPIASAKRFAWRLRSDRRLVVEAGVWLVGVACGLQVLRFSALRTLVDRLSRSTRACDVTAEDRVRVATQVSWAITAAARLPFLRTCLVRAMSAELMLRRRGIDARFQVGAKRPRAGRPLEAHAWIELDGQTIVGQLPNHAEYFVLSPQDPGQGA